MDKVSKILSSVFLGIGIVFTGVGIAAAVSTQGFLDHAVRATGQVTALEERRSSDDNSVLFAPVFRFETASGRAITVHSASASRPAAYEVGESVEVAYLEAAPNEARLPSFFELWGLAAIMGGVGSVFALVGGVILYIGITKARRDVRLQREGTRVLTDFQNVELNTSVRVNHRNPWRIVTQWRNPASGKVHLFESNNLWFDPTPYIAAKQITVFIDPRNPKHFYMDVSFLPELAE